MQYFKAVWNDGYNSTVTHNNGKWQVVGSKYSFDCIEELTNFYQGDLTVTTLMSS